MGEAHFFKSEKNVFWEALIIAIAIFIIGLMFGAILENWRKRDLEQLYINSELSFLDLSIHSDLVNLKILDCNNLVSENINFGDQIFKEAVLLTQFEESQAITEALKTQHKKYDLLRVLFWINSIKIKRDCKSGFHNVVYIYDYVDPSIETKARQIAFSKVLNEIKEKEGDKVMLIPFAGDNNITSIDVMMRAYNISERELPVILIDEKIKITELKTADEIIKLMK